MRNILIFSTIGLSCANDLHTRRLSRFSTLNNYYSADDVIFRSNSRSDDASYGFPQRNQDPVIFRIAGLSFDYSNPVIVCPDNYHLFEGECISKISEPPLPGCSQGMYLRSDGVCQGADRMNASKSCPLGFDESTSSTCIKKLTADASFKCEEGYFLDLESSTCIKRLSTSVHFTCPTASVQSGTSCNVTKTVSKVLLCDDPTHEIFSDGTCHHVVEKMLFFADDVVTPKDDEKMEFADDAFSSPPFQEKEENISICPPDYTLLDRRCASNFPSSTTWICPEGSTETADDSICQSTHYVAPLVSCADPNFSLSKDEKSCELIMSVKPSLECPYSFFPETEDTDDNFDEIGQQKMPIDTKKKQLQERSLMKCYSHVRAIKKAFCPTGYQLLYGSLCQKDTASSADSQCRMGLSYNPVTEMCEVEEKISPLASCQRGWEWDSNQQMCKCLANQCTSLRAPPPPSPPPLPLGFENGDGHLYAYRNDSEGPNGGRVVNYGGQSFEVFTKTMEAPPPEVIVQPQYLVLPEKKKRGQKLTVVTPASNMRGA
eukprot:GDKJ01031525.1.p1 GENE.GDKJ01031525.1~~GDKJ01031525.1.p1  ORF type:complete len:555 (+),score=92.05 GDKJ01031525.1:31-1665(+)